VGAYPCLERRQARFLELLQMTPYTFSFWACLGLATSGLLPLLKVPQACNSMTPCSNASADPRYIQCASKNASVPRWLHFIREGGHESASSHPIIAT
jgi:hypothetical protein